MAYGETAFGPSSKIVQRQHQKQKRHGFWLLHKGLQKGDSANVIAHASNMAAGNLKEALSLVRVQKKLDGQAKVQGMQADIDLLEQYRHGSGLKSKELLATRLPDFCSAFADSLHPVHVLGGHCLCMDSKVHRAATAAMGYASHSMKTNLGKCVEQEWHELHRLLQAPQSTGEPSAKVPRKPCVIAGMCLCSGRGKLVRQFRNRLYQHLKLCLASKTGKTLMADGNVVVSLTSRALEGHVDIVEAEPLQIWLHLGLMYLRPYRCTWQQLLAIEPPSCEETIATSLGRQYLQDIDFEQHWHVQLYEVDCDARTIPNMVPNVICVKPFDAERALLWPVKRAKYKRRAQREWPATTPLHTDSFAMEADQGESYWATELLDQLNYEEQLQKLEGEKAERLDKGRASMCSKTPSASHDYTGSVLQESEPEAALLSHGAASSSSGHLAPIVLSNVPPAEAVKRAANRRGPNMHAEASVQLPNGKISYYASKNCFEASCCSKHHGKRCCVTRTAAGRTRAGGRKVGGRPCGFLGCWLERGICGTKEQHMDLESNLFNQSTRLDMRRHIATLPGGPELLACERPKADGEASEPEGLIDSKALTPQSGVMMLAASALCVLLVCQDTSSQKLFAITCCQHITPYRVLDYYFVLLAFHNVAHGLKQARRGIDKPSTSTMTSHQSEFLPKHQSLHMLLQK
eukprot:6492709-Amphidinium_carterae.2